MRSGCNRFESLCDSLAALPATAQCNQPSNVCNQPIKQSVDSLAAGLVVEVHLLGGVAGDAAGGRVWCVCASACVCWRRVQLGRLGQTMKQPGLAGSNGRCTLSAGGLAGGSRAHAASSAARGPGRRTRMRNQATSTARAPPDGWRVFGSGGRGAEGRAAARGGAARPRNRQRSQGPIHTRTHTRTDTSRVRAQRRARSRHSVRTGMSRVRAHQRARPETWRVAGWAIARAAGVRARGARRADSDGAMHAGQQRRLWGASGGRRVVLSGTGEC